MRRSAAALVTLGLAVAACGGGSHSSSSAAAPPGPASTKAAVEAAVACRMWSELVGKVTKTKTPDFAAATAAAEAIAPVANKASEDDPRWNQLALDIAPANDFKSAALPDQDQRITADCKAVPKSAVDAAAAQPDPYSSTTTTR